MRVTLPDPDIKVSKNRKKGGQSSVEFLFSLLHIWLKVLDTSLQPPNDFLSDLTPVGEAIQMECYSSVILKAAILF